LQPRFERALAFGERARSPKASVPGLA